MDDVKDKDMQNSSGSVVVPADNRVALAPIQSTSSLPELGRLYKQRFIGLFAMFMLNIVGGISWPWFGPIANNVADEFGFTLDQINWLANIITIIYLPVAVCVPFLVARIGMRRSCDIGVACIVIASWVRYSGTARSLPRNGAYALIIIGQFFAALAQPIFQIMGPIYSENWFDLKGRTTATMIISMANPVGGAIGQLLSPLVGDTRQSILILGIIGSAVCPVVLLVSSIPPTPPTYAASQPSPSLWHLLRVVTGFENNPGAKTHMTIREKFDFIVIVWVFGIFVASINTFSILTAQILNPVGYSSDTAGLMGACLLLSGLVAAIISAPLFDRVFVHHLAIAIKVLIPILAIAWLSMIWAVKPGNTGGLYAIMVIMGVTGLTLLPIALELACDCTRNADASASLLWFSGNMFGTIFVLVEGALRANEYANPPLNMKKALIFNAVMVMSSASLVFFIKGDQTRKKIDEQKLQDFEAHQQEQQLVV